MTISLHEASVVTFLRGLGILGALLDRAEAHASSHGIPPSALISARLHVTTAYDILRHNGVALRKADYLSLS